MGEYKNRREYLNSEKNIQKLKEYNKLRKEGKLKQWNEGLIGFGKFNKGRKRPDVSKRRNDSEVKQKFIEQSKKRPGPIIAYERILKEVVELEKQGFRCIPIGKVVPDIIGIKDGKVFAIEVEYHQPHYEKYTDDIRKYFDDIIWIIKKKRDRLLGNI